MKYNEASSFLNHLPSPLNTPLTASISRRALWGRREKTLSLLNNIRNSYWVPDHARLDGEFAVPVDLQGVSGDRRHFDGLDSQADGGFQSAGHGRPCPRRNDVSSNVRYLQSNPKLQVTTPIPILPSAAALSLLLGSQNGHPPS